MWRILQLVFVLLLAVGCGASTVYGGIPYKEPACLPGDKEQAWDDYLYWHDALMRARQKRIAYCWYPDYSMYADYCIELEIYAAQVERYTKHLDNRYMSTCPPTQVRW